MGKWEFTQLEPTAARGKLFDEIWDHPDWWAEWKMDGDRRIGQFTSEGVRFTGRRTSKKTGLLVEKTEQVPHLAWAEGNWSSLEGTVLDGEFLLWYGRSKEVTSIMGSLPDLAVEKQRERGWIEWGVFDCLFYKGTDLRQRHLYERREYLERAVKEWSNPYAYVVDTVTQNTAQFLEEIWAEKYEGVIFKHRNSLYHQKNLWVKVKREATHDVVITGYEEPNEMSEKVDGSLSVTKLHANGWIGAVKFGQYRDGQLIECGQCSGMDDETRQNLSNSKDSFINSVMEIKANEREETGKFRHPRFVQLRPDRDPESCLWSEM